MLIGGKVVELRSYMEMPNQRWRGFFCW